MSDGLAQGRLNADAPWDVFNSELYFTHNYSSIRGDDRRIVECVRDFFAGEFAGGRVPPAVRGIDVGTGSNFYPALAMLPFCERIDLYDYSAGNVSWLLNQQARRWPTWGASLRGFWQVYEDHPGYRDVPDVCALLAERCVVTHGSVFDLEPDPADRYGVGTMFFVAESLSDQQEEFTLAVRRFLGALRPGAPFAAAFMEHSQGYVVDGVSFPATPIAVDDVILAMECHSADVVTERVPVDGVPLRPGYTGMIVAVGRTASTV